MCYVYRCGTAKVAYTVEVISVSYRLHEAVNLRVLVQCADAVARQLAGY